MTKESVDPRFSDSASSPEAGGSRNVERRRLRPSGGYRQLRAFHVATVIYDGTVSFCDRFVDRRSRTHDQMVQAARSGRQNIAEGSRAAATTSQTELRLVNVARASLDELLLDYEDFLRQRKLRAWAKDDAEALAVRSVGANVDQADPTDRSDPATHWRVYARWLESDAPEIVANALICLVHQTNYLLDRQISALERNFVKSGGYSEQLAAARLEHRRRNDRGDRVNRNVRAQPAVTVPHCPRCGGVMALRMARSGARAGTEFWGCTGFPQCSGTRQLAPPAG